MTPGVESLAEIQALYDRSLFLAAHRRAQEEGPYSQWQGTRALLLAGRLCGQLGARRRSEMFVQQAFEADRSDPAARYFRAYRVFGWRGPLAAWALLRREGNLEDADADTLGSWYALHASALGALRDFDRAWEWWRRADAAAPGSPWVRTRKAELLSRQDRHPEALEASREALDLLPDYRVAVVGLAHELTNLDRVPEAIEVLERASRSIESSDVVAMLGGLCEELGRHDDAARCWDRYQELSPLLEPPGRRFLAGRRSDTAYHRGDLPAAARLARRAGGGFFEKIAGRLEHLAGGERVVRLKVGFVKQHHMTCAPATLAMLSAFWGRPLDHLALAGEICYAGTPDHVQHEWLSRHGWLSRPFTVTWDAAVALLDRGVPFALGTRGFTTAHLQAVIGYDARRRTLLLRDPNFRCEREVEADAFFEAYRSCGPRGVALVPREEAARLEGLDLPETALLEAELGMLEALRRHDRPAAGRAFEALAALAPDHRITHGARLELAAHDGDAAARLAALDRLAALFPDERRFPLMRAGCLHELARAEDRLRHLRTFALSREHGSPFFWEQYAEELRGDARQHPLARRLLRRAIAAAPDSAMAYHVLGDLHWGRRELAEALELYRFAACLDDKDEHLAWGYFFGARSLGRPDEGLEFLVARARRLGRQGSHAARTAFQACDELERTERGFALLEEARALRPDDGELLLFTAQQHGRVGRLDRAAELLASAGPGVPPAARLRTEAWLARARGDSAAAMRLWAEVAALEPRALDAHRELALDLADREGMPAARAFLERWATETPFHFGVWQMLCEWMRGEPEQAEACLRHLLDVSPHSAWTLRELGWNLALRRRFPEALSALDSALALEPHSSFGHAARARVLREQGETALAREAAQAALRISADEELALDELLALAPDGDERRAALAFTHAELMRQNVSGEGLEAFHARAEGKLEPAVLLAQLRALHERHPGLWQSWATLLRHLATHSREEARDLARRATEHFPLLPRAWVERARLAHALGEPQEERTALERARDLSPGWTEPLRLLAEWHDTRGDLPEARRTLEQAIAREPREAVNHGLLAEVLWREGERERALAEVEAAARLDLDYGWAWGRLAEWAAELGQPDRCGRVAREVTAGRGDLRSFMLLARRLGRPEDLPERLAALDRALALAPRLVDAHALKSELLAEAGRVDEALAAARPAAFGGAVPARLQGCEAYALARRGDLAAAAARMREVVAAEPEHFEGWAHLADWYEAMHDGPGYLAAARRMAELRPNLYVCHGYLGHALLVEGHRSEAKEHLRRALNMEGSYVFAASWLFDLTLQDGEPEEARRVLELLRGRLAPPLLIEREVRLAAKTAVPGSGLTALERLEALILAADEPEPLQSALQTLAEVGLDGESHARLRAAVLRPGTPTVCGQVWAGVALASLGLPTLADHLEAELLPAATPASLRAVGDVLQRLADQGRVYQVRRLVKRCAVGLKQHTYCWGSVGYALFRIGRLREVAQWLADHHGREGLGAWMLYNLRGALLALGRSREAFEVSRAALALPPDGSVPSHRLTLALGEVLEGRREPAREARALPPGDLPRDGQFLHALVGAALAVEELPQRPGLGDLGGVRALLGEAHAICPPAARSADDHAALGLVLRRIAGRPLAPTARLWSWLERLRFQVQRLRGVLGSAL